MHIYNWFPNTFQIFKFRLDYIINVKGILLRFPFQNRTFLERKPYVFGSENVRFWNGNHKRETAWNKSWAFQSYVDSYPPKQIYRI